MPTGSYNQLAASSLLSVLTFSLSLVVSFAVAISIPQPPGKRSDGNPLDIDWDPAPSPEDGPALSAGATRDPAYLPAQIGGIVGSYAISLVIVAIGLLALAKTRRERLRFGEGLDSGELELPSFQFPVESDFKSYEEYLQFQQYIHGGYQPQLAVPQTPSQHQHNFPDPLQTPKSPYKNFSYPDQHISPISPIRSEYNPNTLPSPGGSTIVALGYDLSVDQSVIQQDRQMAQQQLEDMYKYVMEQEEAKQQGRAYEGPPLPAASQEHLRPVGGPVEKLKKGRFNKPSSLNLDRDEKTQSRGSSIFSSILKSPRKKNIKAVNISSPIMTPMSGTFPRYGEGEEMNTIPPRQYAPVPPPPVPTNQNPYLQQRNNNMPLTPEMSPTSQTSIDGRLGAVLMGPPPSRFANDPRAQQPYPQYHSRDISAATTEAEADPISAVSDKSTSPLVGLPSSPKPGVNRFPSLPASPRPGQTFSNSMNSLPLASPSLASPIQQSFARSNAPSAVRTGGALPLRAYEPSLASPRITNQQTVFTRAGPLSPGMGTPYTGAAVPYSPYQPFSPVIPMTPSLVTKADRKRMKRFEPKTPTVEMVQNTDDIW